MSDALRPVYVSFDSVLTVTGICYTHPCLPVPTCAYSGAPFPMHISNDFMR